MSPLQRWMRRIAAFVLLILAFTITGLGFGYYWFDKNVLSTLPTDLSSLRNYRPPTSCQVFAANGAPIDTFYLERRIWVPLAELPDVVWQAFISAEDRRFLEHPGVDLFGIVRAFWVNLRSGRSRQGGSTITQQLVKNLIVGKEHSYLRKMREAALAWRLEKELRKSEILELYLNYVALGSGNYGVEAAAQDYFGLSARQINVGQAALLAGLVPAPSRYSPRSNPERAAQRREIVLLAMVEQGRISMDEAAKYVADPVLQPREPRRGPSIGTAYATEVRRELRRIIGTEVAATEGLKVYTPLDLEIQREAEEAVRAGVHALESRQGRMGAVRRLAPDRWDDFLARAPGFERKASSELVYPRRGECFEALVGWEKELGRLRAGAWTFSLIASERETKVRERREGERPGALKTTVEPGDVLRVCLDEPSRVRLDPRPWGEGASAVLENATGRVIALVGGYDVALEGFVRATQARRQPGSSFKPYVYAAALLKGRTQLDKIVDGPISLPAGGGKQWAPSNYDGRFWGPVTLRQALAYSLNTAAVRLALQTGVDDVVRTAKEMGVESPLRKDPTIALGSSEVTPMDHAIAYATIARMGLRAEPIFIDRMLDIRGREVGASGGDVVVNGEHLGRLPGGAGRRVLSPGVAYELIDMLRQVVQKGTGRAANKAGYDRAGKTGTTNGFVDAWFVGFTPRYTVSVWIGTDGTATLGEKESGGRAALPAWIRIVESLPHVEGERFPVPDEALLVRAESDWVGLPRGNVPESALGVRSPGSAPLPAFETDLAGRPAASARTGTRARALLEIGARTSSTS